MDLTLDMIRATVEIDQPTGSGMRTVGTGFLIQAPTPDGRPRVVLITAGHVFKSMPGDEARIGWRYQDAGGVWRFQPTPLKIRDQGQALWAGSGDRDVAVMAITAPDAFARAAIPLSWLADQQSFDKYGVGPGDEMMALGYPEGLASNRAGFPILRYGRVASYPLTPASEFPTFLLDFHVYKGNSGGPVFLMKGLNRGPGAPDSAQPQLIAGMLAQQTTVGDENLDLGIVLHAAYIREAIAAMDAPQARPADGSSVAASRQR
ncbi:MAG: trypsin-like serine peptidase [Caulobacteraceae bacterium]